MNSYRIELTDEQGLGFLLAIFILSFLLAWVVPSMRRKGDMPGSELLTIRAIAIFYNGWIFSSQFFCRITAYENKFIWCCILSNSYAYSDLKIDKSYVKGDLSMKISINGISARLIGRAEALSRLEEKIKNKILA
ncbi:hypothetical protein [Achromobacter sp. K91]|uniref:hypothetical protein n=1 Tax=Achromobacter sp. K91 TaxID=2292262 RepID=UPI0011C353C0|nr:hypothetical protein [Achromobacter sp. K91]